jgi:probable HAF family extracellular repeat protein
LLFPVFVCAALVSDACGAASLTALGSLKGTSFVSEANGVSRDGSVVVGYSYSTSGYEAFRWTNGSGMVGLGHLSGGGGYSTANGVSDDGSVIVGYSDSTSDYKAFRWTSGTGMVGLENLPDEIQSQATAVSGDGATVVGFTFSEFDPLCTAFQWTSGTGMVELQQPPFRSATILRAYAITGDGTRAVGEIDGQAVRWTGTEILRLGDLPGSAFYSVASGVSDDGSVVVGHSDATSGYEPFRWTSGSGMVGLGHLPGGEAIIPPPPASAPTGPSSLVMKR